MFCGNCGAQIAENAVFCPHCGNATGRQAAPAAPAYEAPQQTYQAPAYEAPQQTYQAPVYEAPQQTYQAPVYEAPQQTYQAPAYQPNYAAANANAPVRKIGFGEACKLFFQNYANFSGRAPRSEFWWSMLLYGIGCCIPVLGYIWMLGTIVPYISVAWRRLHDVGEPGSKFFMWLIPVYGTILMIKTGCKESDGDNEYGPRKI